MPHSTLFTTLAVAIVLAFVFGFAAKRVGLSPIVGYLIAGIAAGPHTPGLVADSGLALELSEVGVILLMFGVGLKFSLSDLMAVRGVALPGALVQMATGTALGYGLGVWIGMEPAEAFLFGFALSVASTVVLLRALEDHHLLKSAEGRLSVGWLVVEDLAIILAIVLMPAILPALNGRSVDAGALSLVAVITLLKVATFAALMLIVGARLFPWLIVRVAHTRSRELVSLAALALALGIAYAAYAWFGASFALGAFLAGLSLNGSRASHRVAEDSLPLRDTFAVLFFVSVGMLFDPSILLRAPLPVAAVAAIIILGKGAVAFALCLAFRLKLPAAVLVAVALAQIGEFTFVLAGLGQTLEVMSAETTNLLLAGSLISIALNPMLFSVAAGMQPRPVEPKTPVPV